MQIPSNIPVNSDQKKCVKKCESDHAPQIVRISRSKDELAYWKAAIRLMPDSPYFYAEIQRGGIRRKVSLETSNRAAAAHRARDIWLKVRALGWPGYLEKYRPECLPNPDPSVGDFLQAVQKTADLEPRTLRDYTNALRKIIADLKGLSGCRAKYGQGKGYKTWIEKVHSAKLSALSADNVQEWKRKFLATAGQDPISQRSAKVSVNSYLRCAKSLFSEKILKHVKLKLPDPLPFSDVGFEPRPSCKYRSSFDIAELVGQARDQLAPLDPEAFKAFVLAAMVGLRRKEIDLLEWASFRWDQSLIRIETTEFFAAKSEDSLGDVHVEPQLMEIFRGYLATATGRFVIESLNAPRPELTYRAYRCEEVFGRLIDWLKAHGVTGAKPLHTLRKEFGSEVCRHFGVYAASKALRHSDIKITTQHYTEDRSHATVGLGHLLEPAKVIEFKQAC